MSDRKQSWIFAFILKPVAIVLLAHAVASCAQPGRPGLMAAPSVMPEVIGANPSLQNSVAVVDVTGGRETNPLWMSQVGSAAFKNALENSLRNNVLLAGGLPSQAQYQVSAHLLELEQPFVGVSMTVTSRVSYHVIKKGAAEVFMDEEISTPYTASFGSSLLGAERLRLANEGSVRENISEFLKRFINRWVAQSRDDNKETGIPTS